MFMIVWNVVLKYIDIIIEIVVIIMIILLIIFMSNSCLKFWIIVKGGWILKLRKYLSNLRLVVSLLGIRGILL